MYLCCRHKVITKVEFPPKEKKGIGLSVNSNIVLPLYVTGTDSYLKPPLKKRRSKLFT